MDFKNPFGRCVADKNEDTLSAQFMQINNWSVKKSDSGDILMSWDDRKFSIDSDNTYLTTHSDNKILKKDLIYLEMAKVWGKNSYCKRMQVGCLIVKDKSIISDGYNGTPTGFPNVCETEDMVTLPYVLHAEANAITKLAKSVQSSEEATLYVTLSPCFECSKLIIQSGIKRVVFSEVYRIPDSLSFLVEAGIEIVKISN